MWKMWTMRNGETKPKVQGQEMPGKHRAAGLERD